MVRAAAGFVRRHFELDRHDLAFAAQFDPVFLLDRLGFLAVGHAGRSGREPDFDRTARHAAGLEVAGQGKSIPGIDSLGHFQIDHADVRRPPVAAQSHGVDGDFGQSGQRRGRGVLDPLVPPSVGKQDQAGDRSAPFLVGQVADGVAQPSLQTARGEFGLPVDVLRLPSFVGGRTIFLALAGHPAGVGGLLPADHRQQLDGRIAEIGNGQHNQAEDQGKDSGGQRPRAPLRIAGSANHDRVSQNEEHAREQNHPRTQRGPTRFTQRLPIGVCRRNRDRPGFG